jgi:heme/copper-type cytochrome/quinol oxidase subunit 2
MSEIDKVPSKRKFHVPDWWYPVVGMAAAISMILCVAPAQNPMGENNALVAVWVFAAIFAIGVVSIIVLEEREDPSEEKKHGLEVRWWWIPAVGTVLIGYLHPSV